LKFKCGTNPGAHTSLLSSLLQLTDAPSPMSICRCRCRQTNRLETENWELGTRGHRNLSSRSSRRHL